LALDREETGLAELDASATGRTRYSARKDEILAVATEVFNDQGSRGFTLAAVAKRLDMHPVSLSYYFKKREDLAAACLLSTIERFEELLAVAENGRDPAERLTIFLRAYFDVQRRVVLGEHPQIASFSEIRLIGPPNGPVVNAAYMQMFQRMARMLGSSSTSAALPRRRLSARLLIEHLGWSTFWLTLYEPEDYLRCADRLADILIGGLAAPGQTWPTPAPIELGSPPSNGGDVTRERFLVAATDLINAWGYHGASVDKISAKLNVTKGSFYYHNTDKDDLVVACFERTFAILREAQRRARGGNGWERLCAIATALSVYQASGERGRMLRAYAFAALPPDLRQTMRERSRLESLRIAALISEGVADGSMRAVDPMIAAQTVMAMINSSAFLNFLARDFRPQDVTALYVQPSMMGFFTEI
jgi:AcrR family transcriptional regulator